MATNPSESIYDHPLYYDILFGWDRSAEARFYDALRAPTASRRARGSSKLRAGRAAWAGCSRSGGGA